MHHAARIGPERIVRHEHDARCANRHQCRIIGDRTDAAGRRGIVATTTRHGRPLRHAPGLGDGGRQLPGRIGALIEFRHLVDRHVRCIEQQFRPRASGDVQPVGAGRIRHVGGIVAGHAVADVVLRQQHLGDLRKHFRLVLFYPHELGCGITRQRHIAGQRHGTGLLRHDLLAFAERARIIPQDAGTQHLAGGIEQCGAMLLA